MPIETLVDVLADCAAERNDFQAVLRMRWLTNAASSASLETNNVVSYVIKNRDTKFENVEV